MVLSFFLSFSSSFSTSLFFFLLEIIPQLNVGRGFPLLYVRIIAVVVDIVIIIIIYRGMDSLKSQLFAGPMPSIIDVELFLFFF